MNVILAESFTAALARLNGQEQKQAKLAAYDIQTAPDAPGLQLHRIDASKDPNFWSARVNRDVRIILHKTPGSTMLVYVDHHDDAYAWAERRRIEAHPATGAIQIVEVRERVEDVGRALSAPAQAALAFDATPEPKTLLFDRLSPDDLLSVGVPQDWIADVRAADDDGFLDLAGHLPSEASEALLAYVSTGALIASAPPAADPLKHPDTQRRFRVLDGAEELRAALDAPFDRWTVFLHPSQRGVVNRDYSGPARVAGSAGTGKTVVAVHRVMKILRRDPDARVLLTTFSEPLAHALRSKLALLVGEREGLTNRVTVGSFQGVAKELVTLATGRTPHLADDATVRSALLKARDDADYAAVSDPFLFSEWTHVVDARRIDSLEAYSEAPRMGRKTRLGAKQREALWSVFSRARDSLARRGLLTPAGLFAEATRLYAPKGQKPFSHIVVDEAQDLGPAELRFLAAIASDNADAMFFAGDLGQRIFQQPFSWKGLGVDIRGRSATLKVNYRTSHQIRRAADRLLPESVRDVDGMEDERSGTVSVFDGPEPQVIFATDVDDEIAAVSAFLQSALEDGVRPAEIGVFVRSEGELGRARAAIERAGLSFTGLSAGRSDDGEAALVGTMHLAKGLEFRAVVAMACDEGVLPLGSRIEDIADAFELDEVIATERQLLYVAATRARDRLMISCVRPGSDFLSDFAAR